MAGDDECNARSSSVRAVSDQPLVLEAAQLVVVSCVRNERLRMPQFLEHYRRLGVGQFLIVDNESTDGTAQFLARQDDVYLLTTGESYAASHCGVNWINHVLHTWARGHWTLTVDADELFVFPGCESTRLDALTSYLDRTGADGIECFLLDMYSRGPIRSAVYSGCGPFLDVCPYFDLDGYLYPPNDLYRYVPTGGGPRHRLFWEGYSRDGASPYLGKIPLVKWREGLRYEASTHVIQGLRLSALTAVLLHFKLFSDFVDRAEAEASRGEHWRGAHQYKTYADVMRSTSELTAYHPGSVQYRDSAQLIELGLMRQPSDYVHH